MNWCCARGLSWVAEEVVLLNSSVETCFQGVCLRGRITCKAWSHLNCTFLSSGISNSVGHEMFLLIRPVFDSNYIIMIPRQCNQCVKVNQWNGLQVLTRQGKVSEWPWQWLLCSAAFILCRDHDMTSLPFLCSGWWSRVIPSNDNFQLNCIIITDAEIPTDDDIEGSSFANCWLCQF